MSANISKLVSNVGYFPTNSSLGQITSWLEPRIEKLLPTSFDEMLKSLVL